MRYIPSPARRDKAGLTHDITTSERVKLRRAAAWLRFRHPLSQRRAELVARLAQIGAR